MHGLTLLLFLQIQVQQALNRSLQGRTVIVIAHRLSTVENADRIIVINKGEVVEQGSHGDLLKKGGMYAMLVSKQMVADVETDSWKDGEVEKDIKETNSGSGYESASN